MSTRDWLVRLYPAAWRARYGAELADILEQQSLSPRLVTDVLLGALDAHLHPGLSPALVDNGGTHMFWKVLACRPTPHLLLITSATLALLVVLAILRRTYGFGFGLDFFYFATLGLLPMALSTSSPITAPIRSQRRRLLAMLGVALLTGLLGTFLTNGLPR